MNGGRQLRATSGDTLDSWKEIAAYLHRDVRTVIRWEHTRGLPVHRIPGGGRPGVFALKPELDTWRKGAEPHVIQIGQGSTPRSPTRSIAVLPFANLSSAEQNAYFSDGLADEIITALTRIPGLRVTARTSSFAFRGHEHDIRDIGRRLGVTAILEGSVQRSGRRLRVSAQLVDAGSGFHLWSEHYDRRAGDVFAIEDEISQAIAAALEVRLADSHVVRPVRNQEAYNCWLKARYYQQYETFAAYARCKTYLRQAIALDPQFPQPFLGLAELARAAAEVALIAPREAFVEGRAAIRRAFELDRRSGEAYALSGAYRAWTDFDWSGASADFERALELTPASAQVHRLRATHYLVPTGRLKEAEDEMQTAVELDPVSPLAHIELGRVLLYARNFERAQVSMEAAFELRPDYWLAEWYRGVGLYFQGRLEAALATWQSVEKKTGVRTPGGIGPIGLVLGQLGRRAEARAALADLDAAERERYVPPLNRAQIHMGLGETNAALECLDRAVEQRDSHILDLPVKPSWDGLRGDPRFGRLLRKMHLA